MPLLNFVLLFTTCCWLDYLILYAIAGNQVKQVEALVCKTTLHFMVSVHRTMLCYALAIEIA